MRADKDMTKLIEVYSDEKILGTDNCWTEKDKIETKKEKKKSFYDDFNYVYYSKQ